MREICIMDEDFYKPQALTFPPLSTMELNGFTAELFPSIRW